MTRPSVNQIAHTQQGWDSDVNDAIEAAFEAPFPPVEYADKTTLDAVAPGEYDRCLAMVADEKQLYMSDGDDWIPVQLTEDYSAAAAAFGARTRLVARQELVATTSGGSVASTIQFPKGCRKLGVSTYIETEVTGPTSVDIGDGTDADLYGSHSTLTADEATGMGDETADPTGYVGAAEGVTLTANGGNFTAGAIRVVLHYLEFVGPSS